MINTKNRLPLFVLVLAGFCAGCGNEREQETPQADIDPEDGNGEQKSLAGKELDPKVVTAWQSAGAHVGWLAISEFGEWMYLIEKPTEIASLPVFLWEDFEPGVFTKLPTPSKPFAIGLGGTGMDNEGLKELARFQNLDSLDLSHTQVTDAGLKELAAINSLHSLDLGASMVTDAGLKELVAVKSLQKLYFGSTAVTDVGVTELAALKDLQILYLYNTQLTDAGLKELAGFKKLQVLILGKTQVTDEAVADMGEVRPELRIVR